jgi:hypothetical protein
MLRLPKRPPKSRYSEEQRARQRDTTLNLCVVVFALVASLYLVWTIRGSHPEWLDWWQR